MHPLIWDCTSPTVIGNHVVYIQTRALPPPPPSSVTPPSCPVLSVRLRDATAAMNKTINPTSVVLPRCVVVAYRLVTVARCACVCVRAGYGHIVPVTPAGRIITMIYAAVGIPLCLVVLASVGKLLTRAIKHLWSFVLLFYYTGSFRRVRHMVPLSRLRMTFMQRVRDRVHRRTLRRLAASQRQPPSTADNANETDACVATTAAEAQAELQRLETIDKTHVVSFEVDDKFNLPPIVALSIAVLYIVLGVALYRIWEPWTYLEAFYFLVVSLSTVGFGDIIPAHPKFFLASSVYMLIGLALIAMVVNVVMETVNSTIAIAKNKVFCVGRRLVDVAQMQTERLSHQHPGAAFKELHHTMAVQGLVFRPKRFQRRCSV